jgi:Protein of unknown function (DUF2786)
MPSDPLAKIHRLLALSASDNENEARNAAHAACRLILEHGVEFRLPGRRPVVRLNTKRSAPKEDFAVSVQKDVQSFDFEGFIRPGYGKRASRR